MRRYCHLSAAQVKALEWWEYRLLVDGLIEEFSDDDYDTATPAPTTRPGTPASLAEQGFTVRAA